MAGKVVLDASALLVLLHREPGARRVADRIAGAAISAVNLAEVIAVLTRRGVPVGQARDALEPLDLDVRPFGPDDAYLSAELASGTRRAGLSLGDRACLALGKRLSRAVLTADRSWTGLKLGIEIVLVR